MGQPNEGPKPFESDVGKDIVRSHFELRPPSANFLAKHERFRLFMRGSQKAEHKVKLDEGGDVLALRVRAVTSDQEYNPDLDEKECCVNDEERNAYCDTMDECLKERHSPKEDKDAVRRTLMEALLKDPHAYLEHFRHWKERWEEHPEIQKKYKDFHEYVLEKGKDFVRRQLERFIERRINDFQKNSMPPIASDEEREAKLKEMTEKVRKFRKVHEKEIAEYESDPNSAKSQKLFQQFIAECGFTGAKKEEVKELFEDIVGDIATAYGVIHEYEINSDDLCDMADLAYASGTEIDEAKWNAVLQKNFQNDPYFKEVMQQQQAAVYQPGGEAGFNKEPLLSPQAVALEAGGLRIMGGVSYDEKTDTYTCTVRYPDSDYEVEMRIGKVPGAKTFDNATFTFEDPYADKAKGKKVTLTRQNLRSGCNQMFLDYLMNERIQQINPSPDFSANDILGDAMLLSMAERLFNLNFNNIVLTPDMRSIFTRFLQVLMQDDQSTAYGNLGSFQARVKKMDTVLAKPQYAKRLLEEFKEHKNGFASVIPPPVSKILEKIDYKE